jgi:hypothetical protein
MSQQDTQSTQKSRRDRLSPYTAAERRMKKVVAFGGDPIIARRHLERGLGRKSFSKKMFG